MSHYRFISMLIGLGVLSACNDPDERKLNAQNDNGADVSMSIDGGNNGATAKVSLSLPSLKLNAPEVDLDGVKLPPGARVTGIDLSGQEGTSEGGVTIRFDSDLAPDKVRDYFLAAFKEKGMTAAKDATGISGRDHSGKAFRIELTDQGSGTRGTVHQGSKAN
jgi:hypothetical protein